MDERAIQGQPAELPVALSHTGTPEPALADARALTILTTEHWSLLTARSLVYNETFARAGMFLAFLSATLVGLGLVSTATGFSNTFLAIAAAVLAVDLFVGLATYGRVLAANRESFRYLQGMNRLRHAYHETVPGLERYFVSGHYDDARGVFGVAASAMVSAPGTVHHFTTMPGMVSVVCASVAAALGTDLILLATGSGPLAALAGIAVVLLGIAASALVASRGMRTLAASIDSIFPTPAE
ncbi:MAG TPA: hypothetical protein VF763_04360 [Candidatus Limnocylindrales bacterium]